MHVVSHRLADAVGRLAVTGERTRPAYALPNAPPTPDPDVLTSVVVAPHFPRNGNGRVRRRPVEDGGCLSSDSKG